MNTAAADAVDPAAPDPWRGPRYALVAWAFGPATFLLARCAGSWWVGSPATIVVVTVGAFLQWLGVLVGIVVVSHGCVRRSPEGWCLLGYWVAAIGLFATLWRERTDAIAPWLDAMLATAVAVPLVAATRWLVRRVGVRAV